MYQAKITVAGNKYKATTKNGSFEMASDGTSSKPSDVLLASLCACLAHYVGEYLDENKIRSTGVALTAESELTADGSRFGDIRVAIEVSNATLDDASKTAIMQYVTRCHIYTTLRANSAVILSVSTK